MIRDDLRAATAPWMGACLCRDFPAARKHLTSGRYGGTTDRGWYEWTTQGLTVGGRRHTWGEIRTSVAGMDPGAVARLLAADLARAAHARTNRPFSAPESLIGCGRPGENPTPQQAAYAALRETWWTEIAEPYYAEARRLDRAASAAWADCLGELVLFGGAA